MATPVGSSMEMISGRVPDEIYRWFAELKLEGAATNSDKLRLLLAQLKRQHDGAIDYVSAQSWFRDVTAPVKVSLSRLERDEGIHSEVMLTLVEHLSALAAILVSARPSSKEEVMVLEETLVRRAFAMTEALLRQAVTEKAAAFDPKVVRNHCQQVVQLAKLIS
jgi:hypothetical protein